MQGNELDNDLFVLILNKISLQSAPALETCLNYMSYWVTKRRQADNLKQYQLLFLRVLRKYTIHPLKVGNTAFVEEQLTRIAWTLNNWENQDPIVNGWLERAKTSRFNNVRQYINRADLPSDFDE